jgi:deoxyribose-phosphate aldolase
MTQKAISAAELAAKIDHTLLKPTLTEAEIDRLCQEAITHQFKTVCVPPSWVAHCARALKGSTVGVATVVGFPLGYSTTETKSFETKTAIAAGATEIDMVVNLSYVKSGKIDEIENDIHNVVHAAGRTPVKVIIECAYLTDPEKVEVAKAAERAGAKFVKTSTGFATGVSETGATLADILLLRKNLKPNTLIKASGGIRDFTNAEQLIRAGADRLGTSAGVAILSGNPAVGGY